MDILTNTNICIIEGRPKLHEVIPNIIYGIESGLGMPENYTPGTREIASEMLADRLASSNSSGMDDMDDMAEELACYATELGFHLPTDAISQEFDLFQLSDLTPPWETPCIPAVNHGAPCHWFPPLGAPRGCQEIHEQSGQEAYSPNLGYVVLWRSEASFERTREDF